MAESGFLSQKRQFDNLHRRIVSLHHGIVSVICRKVSMTYDR